MNHPDEPPADPGPAVPLRARDDFEDLIELARRAVRAAAARGMPAAIARTDAPSDLAQSVVREMLARADRLEYRGQAELEGLARRMLRRKVVAKLRRSFSQRRDAARERPIAPDDSAARDRAEPAAADPSPSGVAEAGELELLLGGLLDRLPAREREVLRLRTQGLTHPQIAAALGVSRASSEQLLSRARARLRGALERRDGSV